MLAAFYFEISFPGRKNLLNIFPGWFWKRDHTQKDEKQMHFHIRAERKDKEEISPVPDPSVCFSPEHVNSLFS